MCGYSVYLISELYNKFSGQRFKNLLEHRGPDDFEIVKKSFKFVDVVFEFARLSIINNTKEGKQPIDKFIVSSTATMVCNGEIYNYKDLRKVVEYGGSTRDRCIGSDCNVILDLYDKFLTKYRMNISNDSYKTAFDMTVNHLDGDFSLVIFHEDKIFVARDPIGVRPMFYSPYGFASETKALIHENGAPFPPGTWAIYNIMSNATLSLDQMHQYYTSFRDLIPHTNNNIRTLLEKAVEKRLMSDRPIAFLLSGGLDSSIIAAIAKKYMPEQSIKTFSIGTQESTDLKYARIMAKYLRSDHTEITFDIKDAITSLRKLIWHLESYDCTTIRASMPMFKLSEYISKNTDYRVIISGEGSDELFGGYLYFHLSPSENAFQLETERLVNNLYMYDVLRADRTTAAHGLELRVPFLDKEFVKHVISMEPLMKRRTQQIEKYILRQAFSDILPPEICMRQKEAFSDGVGYIWVKSIKEYAESTFSDEQFSNARFKYPHNTPLSKEEYLYREIYNTMYEKSDINIKETWRPNWTTEKDPSATKLAVHSSKN